MITHTLCGVSHLQLLNNPFACLCYWHDCNFNHKDSRAISEELPTESCMIVTWLKSSNGFLLAALIKNHLVHYSDGKREGEGKLEGTARSLCFHPDIYTKSNVSS